MRQHFELAITHTPWLKGCPLGIMEINGVFSHYMDADTDNLWLGFAIGMRCAERLGNDQRSGPRATDAADTTT